MITQLNFSKGSLEGVLPMLALFIIAGTVTFQSIPISEALADVMGDSTSDINRVVDARSHSEYYFYNSIPQIAEYATNNASLSQASSIGEIEWNRSTIDNYEDTMETIKENWRNETEDNFNAVERPKEGESCQIVEDDDKNYSIDIYPGEYDFRNTDEPHAVIEPDIMDGEMEASCEFDDGPASYRESAPDNPEVEVTSNRYIQLADEATRFFLDLQTELNSVESESDTHSSCGSYPSYSGVEADAAAALEASVSDAIENAESGYPERDGFETDGPEVLVDATYEYGYDSDLVEAVSNEDRRTGSCCSGCGNPNKTNEYTHYTEVEVVPSRTELNWSILDTAQQIIVGRDSENLEFSVDSFVHEFQ